MSNKVPDILILALARWDAPYSSTALSLAKALSQKGRVFLIDNPFTLKDLLTSWNKAPIQRRREALLFGRNRVHSSIKDYPNLYLGIPPLMLPINWLPSGRIYRFLARFNQGRMKSFIRRLIKSHELEEFHLLNIFNPFYTFSASDFPTVKSRTYYSVDRIAESKYVQKHGPDLEKALLSHVDLCLATSSHLKKELEQGENYEVRLLPNAADYDFFSQAVKQSFEVPDAYKAFKKAPVIYLGSIGFRLDFELLEKVIEEMPEQPFVFIGPKGYEYDARLEAFPHVHFTGPIPQHLLLPYVQHAACGIIPFKVNALTAAIYPLKIHEYLAGGLAVVSTAFSEDIISLSEKTYLTKNHYEFGKLLRKAIQETDLTLKKQRSLDSQKDSWQARSEELLKLLKSFESG